MEGRLILTEKGKDFVTEASLSLKFERLAQKQKNQVNLPHISSRNNLKYSIIDTYASGEQEPQLILPKSSDLKTRNLYFYENNKKLMDYHLMNQNRQNLSQKPTIFSRIRDPFDIRRSDYHSSSLDFMKNLNNKFNSSQNSLFFQQSKINMGDLYSSTYFSSQGNTEIPVNNYKPRNILNETQNSFYTKPLVKGLNEIEMVEKVENRKLNYLHEKIKYFEELKEKIELKKEEKLIRKKSAFINVMQEEEKTLNVCIDRKKNERDRFVDRIRRYKWKKFDEAAYNYKRNQTKK